MNREMVKITVYINEGDKWQDRPLHLEILNMLQRNNISGATVLLAVAGFTNKSAVEDTAAKVKGKLPFVIEFIDKIERIESILPELKKMVGPRLILREQVEVINYGLR